MELIVISDPVCFEGEADLINALFDAGMAVFHLRKPDTDKSTYAGLISKIAKQYHGGIALHQFHELAEDFPLIKRLHYPEQHRKASLNAIVDLNGYTLSTSVHHLTTLHELKGFDYAFYGPVFNSISKPGYEGLQKDDLMLPDKDRLVKIIGIGGIDEEKVQRLKEMGFDGIAVLGTIWNNKPQTVNNFKSLITRYKEYFN